MAAEIIIGALVITIVCLVHSQWRTADKAKRLDDAINWLRDNGHLSKAAERHVVQMLEDAE